MNDMRESVECLPFISFSPFQAIGAALCFMRPDYAVAIAIVAAVLFWVASIRKTDRLRLCAAGFLTGAVLSAGYIGLWCKPLFAHDGEIVEAKCYITERQNLGDGIAAYTADVTIGGRKTSLTMITTDCADICDTVTAKLKLKRQTESYDFSQGVMFSATVREIYEVSKGKPTLSKRLSDYRSYLSGEMIIGLGDDVGGLAAAMLLGNKSMLSFDMKQYLKVCGISHLTAVSGMHFSLCLSVLLYIVGKVKSRIVRPIFSLMIIPFMVLFFGAGGSVLRAGFMAAMCNFASVIGRTPHTLNSLCVTLSAIIIVQPYGVMDSGFIMSVLGVYGAGIMAPEVNKTISKLSMPSLIRLLMPIVMVSVCASFCTAPVAISLFGGVSVAGPLIMVLIAPIFAAAMLVTVIFCLTGGMFEILLIPINVCIGIIRAIVVFFGKFSALWLPLPVDISPLLAAIAVAAITAFILTRGEKRRPLRLCAFCISAMVVVSVTATGSANEIIFLSDGRSGAALLRSGRTASVLVAGDGAGLNEDIAACARTKGINCISSIVAQELSYSGAASMMLLAESFDIPVAYVNKDAEKLMALQCEVYTDPIDTVDFGDYTLQTTHVKDSASADIVLYYGYKLSVPENDARIAMYCSSRQTVLPDNGYNIYYEEYVIPIKSTRKE